MTIEEFENGFISFLSEHNIVAEKIHDPTLNIDLIRGENNTYFHLNILKEKAGFHNEEYAIAYENKGKNLIQVWEDQWMSHRNILEARILVLTGKAKKIYARETEIVKLTNPQLLEFLKENHLSVPLKAKIKLGLICKGTLVSVLSLSNPRTFDRKDKKIRSYEILRFCNLKDHVITGGLSKLLKHFINEYQPDHIMTYIDREWGNGDGFKKVGFQRVGHLDKRAFLVNINQLERIHLTQIRQKTNQDEIDFFQVYNAGSIKMELSLNK